MAALLVSLVIMSIVATVAMPVWRQSAQREKEAELIFRAGQVAHAIAVMRRKIPNASPPDLDYLVRQKFLRKKYKDPMTKDGEWRIVTPQELQGINMNMPGSSVPGRMPGQGPAGMSNGRSSFGTPSSSSSSPGGQTSGAGSSPFSPSGFSAPSGGPGSPGGSTGTSSFGMNSGSGRTVNMGPVAAVASKSTQKSIRIFKGRDRYDQWIVTLEDVMPRQFLQPQQPNQPGQRGQPGRGLGSGSGFPGSGSPGSGSPGSGSPGGQSRQPSGFPSRP